jgi:flavin-dependent dehydrogenase
MRMAYDIIVAGAGPGGATAAYELARRGVRVGSFDKHRFPRAKPCGGCLSLKIDRLLEPGLHALVERTIHGVRFTFEGLRPVRRHSARPVAYMVQRERFDAWLVARARAAGAEVHEGEAVRAVHEHADGIEVETTWACGRVSASP